MDVAFVVFIPLHNLASFRFPGSLDWNSIVPIWAELFSKIDFYLKIGVMLAIKKRI